MRLRLHADWKGLHTDRTRITSKALGVLIGHGQHALRGETEPGLELLDCQALPLEEPSDRPLPLGRPSEPEIGLDVVGSIDELCVGPGVDLEQPRGGVETIEYDHSLVFGHGLTNALTQPPSVVLREGDGSRGVSAEVPNMAKGPRFRAPHHTRASYTKELDSLVLGHLLTIRDDRQQIDHGAP